MKTLAEYKFKNNKAIRIVFLDKDEKIEDVDDFALVVDEDDVTKELLHMRPDEMMIIIRLMSDALFKSIHGYEIGFIEDFEQYNGFTNL